MAMPELAIDTVSIVIKGIFDPAKLATKELADNGLFSADDLAQASQKFSTDEVSILETRGIRFVANRELFQLTAQEADEFAPLRDLAVNILRSLDDDRIGVMGINREVHFSVDTQEHWHAVGDSITPKSIWEGVLGDVGLSSVTLTGLRSDLYVGYQLITVQPSNVVSQGIFVSRNDHYTLEVSERAPSSRDQIVSITKQPLNATRDKIPVAIRILNEEWNRSIDRSEEVIELVARQAMA